MRGLIAMAALLALLPVTLAVGWRLGQEARARAAREAHRKLIYSRPSPN